MESIEFFQSIKTPSTVIHVVSVVFGMGAALISDVLFSFFSKNKSLNKTEISTLSTLSFMVHYGLWIVVLSGISIFLSDIEKYSNSDKFLAKITILLVLVVNGFVLNKYVWPHLLKRKFFTAKNERFVRQTAFVCGAISIISWLSICTLGVLDKSPLPYSALVYIYAGITLLGSLIALLVEKRELN